MPRMTSRPASSSTTRRTTWWWRRARDDRGARRRVDARRLAGAAPAAPLPRVALLAARARLALADDLLHRPDGDVGEYVAADRRHRQRLSTDVALGQLQPRAVDLRPAVHPVAGVLGDGYGRGIGHRLPARLHHCLQGGYLEELPARARHRPVLHQLPDPDARMGDDPGRQRAP